MLYETFHHVYITIYSFLSTKIAQFYMWKDAKVFFFSSKQAKHQQLRTVDSVFLKEELPSQVVMCFSKCVFGNWFLDFFLSFFPLFSVVIKWSFVWHKMYFSFHLDNIKYLLDLDPVQKAFLLLVFLLCFICKSRKFLRCRWVVLQD